METKIKILEFSSDVFSKSNQLKDIYISPLFSNTNFSINIFEAISKNEEYKIIAHTQIIKIGLFNGKSLLGVGDININKKSQKIKISSKDKNKKENNNTFLNGAFNKLQDNDYYLTIECINNNINLSSKDINQRQKKKNSSVDNRYKNNLGHNIYKKGKEKNNNLNKKKNNSNILLNNNDIDNDNNMKTNSTVIKSENNNIIKDILLSNNGINDNNNPININNNDNEKETEVNIFNLSFQKELFSDGVLILSNNDDFEFENKNKEISKNIDIHDFENIINEFYLIYNNVSNNNTSLSDNIKENFLLEYQYFLEKTYDIFNLYSKLSNEINNQNEYIKKNIQNYYHKIKTIYKKDKILKIKIQNFKKNDIFKKNIFEEKKHIYYNDIQNINNKLSLINIINKDFLFLIKNNNNKTKYNIFLKEIFKSIIDNGKNKEYLKDYSKIINLIFSNKRVKNNNEVNNDNQNNENIDSYEANNKNGNKVDLEKLKYKIEKLKEQYLNETNKKEYDNKFKIRSNNEKNKKNILHHTNQNLKNIKIKSDRGSRIDMNKDKDKKLDNYCNVFTPNRKKINKI